MPAGCFVLESVDLAQVQQADREYRVFYANTQRRYYG
jgi:hypothetical protein